MYSQPIETLWAVKVIYYLQSIYDHHIMAGNLNECSHKDYKTPPARHNKAAMTYIITPIKHLYILILLNHNLKSHRLFTTCQQCSLQELINEKGNVQY